MDEIEKEIIINEELLKKIKLHFGSLKKIGKNNVGDFIEKNKSFLDSITTNRNWKVWLVNKKKEIKKKKKELDKKDKQDKKTKQKAKLTFNVKNEKVIRVKNKKCDSREVIDLIKELRIKSVKEILKEANEKGTLDISIERGEGIQENRSYRGFVYERLWDICIKFGVVDYLTMKKNEENKGEIKDTGVTKYNTCHLFGNPNRENIDFKKDCWKGEFGRYLNENIQSGNSGGYSDISFINKYTDKVGDKEEVYFISVKYYEKDKSVDNYDIGKLCTLVEKHSGENRGINVLIFVKDKETLIKKFNKQQRSSDIMMKYIDPNGDKTYPNIYGETDLEQNIYKLKLLLEQYNYLQDEDNNKLFESEYLKVLKQPFIPRFHQKLFIDKINELIIKENEKNILVGAIPRSGKSYIMMGTILDYVKKMGDKKLLNFILVTPAPNETFGEYRDIFNDYIDFDRLRINPVELKSQKGRQKIAGDPKKHNVFIVSKQMLGYKEKTDTGKDNEEIKNNLDTIKKQTEKRIEQILQGGKKFDLILLDEAHFGMSTENAQNILNILDGLGKQTPKMFVTATYNKPLSVYGIDAEKCKLTWDINDVQIFQDKDFDINNNEIKERFGGKIYDNALEFFDNDSERIKESYSMYPKPYLMTSIWDYQYLEQEKGKIDQLSYGFDMDKLFTVKNGSFENPDQMKQMMRYYFGYPDKKTLTYGQQHIYRQRGILPRIKKICSGKCRTMQEPNHFTTQLWFLPYGPNRKIVDVVKALIALFNFNEFKDIKEQYHFYVAVDVKDEHHTSMATYMKDSHNIKREIQYLEKDVKKNIIILAGARLQLGISLRNVDIVALWNMVTSSDAIFQMLFRSMTEVDVPKCDEKGYCNKKKFGFMVDLNPQRALTNTLLFGENLSSKKSKGKNKYELIADCINIDEDVFQDKYDTDDPKERKEFVNQMFNKLYSSWDKNVDIRKLTEKVLKYDEDVLKSIEKGLREVKLSKKKGPKKEIVQGADEGFEPGDKVKKEESDEKVVGEDKKETKGKEVKKIPLSQLAAEVISEVISLLNIFSLYAKGDETDCILTSDLTKEDIEEERQIKIINDINELKESVFNENKEIFLEILNGRIAGDYDTMYDENLLNIILDSILKKSSEKGNNLYAINKLVMSQKKKYYTIKEPEKLLEYINDNLSPKEKERKQSGEVFTPIYVVKEMLDKLPNHVWSDHTLKWLDPAVGIGNFPIIVYLKLMEGLKSWESNEEKRRKHILEKMLYMVEISKKSIMILNKVFCGDKYKLNIGKGTKATISFLDDSYDLNDFDVIMANPPYNAGGVGKGGGVFWKGFVEKSLRILNDNGYLVMIHPTGWRKPKGERASGGDIWDSFKQYHLEAVKISDNKIPNFPRVDYYVLNKSKKTSNTHVINEFQSIKTDTKTKLKDLPFIPHLINDDVVSILNKLFNKKGDKFNIIRNQSFQPGKSDTKKSGRPHAFFYDVSKKDYIEVFKTYTDKDKNTEYISKPKIIMTYGNGNKPAFLYPKYYSKDMGGTANTMYQLTDKSDNTGNLMKFLDSQLTHFLLKITQFSEAPNHKNEFKILNMITKPNNGTLKTDEDIYKYYGISKEEQKLIDEIVNFTKPSKRTPKKDKKSSKPTANEVYGDDPKYEGQGDPVPEDMEPEPEPEPKSGYTKRKKKTRKKTKRKSQKIKRKSQKKTKRKHRKHRKINKRKDKKTFSKS
jgi:hypothetical protein